MAFKPRIQTISEMIIRRVSDDGCPVVADAPIRLQVVRDPGLERPG